MQTNSFDFHSSVQLCSQRKRRYFVKSFSYPRDFMATFLTTLSNVKTSELEIACKKEQKNGILAFLRTGQQTISGTFIQMHSYIFQSTEDSNVSKK